MRKLLLFGFVLALTIVSCTPESEPFTYPDDEITEPSTVTHMVRNIKEDEGWEGVNAETGCDGDLNTIDFALFDLTFSRGFATLHLKPDTSTCDLSAGLSTAIRSDEVASDYWRNWKLEFTFSELRLPEEAEVRLQLKYRDADLDLDIGPHMREILSLDTSTIDAEGTFTLNIDEGFNDFQINGITFQPDFSDDSGNRFELGAPQEDQVFDISLSTTGVEDQTLLVFNFVRITSFGIPED